MGRLRWLIGLGLVLCLALSGCGTTGARADSSPTATSLIPTSTPTPQPIALQTLAVGMTGLRMALPGPAGIVLSQQNLAMGDITGSLSFYRYSAHAVEVIATPPAPLNAIADAAYGGDWVAYVAVPGKAVQWQLWAYNVSTAERIEIDSATRESATGEWSRGLHFSGADLYWSVQYPLPSAGPSQWDTKTFDFNFVTRATQVISSAHLATASVLAANDDALLLKQSDNTTGTTTLYYLPRGGSPRSLSQDIGLYAAMGARYALWENTNEDSLTLYDLQTEQMTTEVASCYQPEMSSTAPYAVCVAPPNRLRLLIHLPDAAQRIYGEPQDGSLLSPGPDQIYQNRVFHVTTSGDVQYFDLPPA